MNKLCAHQRQPIASSLFGSRPPTMQSPSGTDVPQCASLPEAGDTCVVPFHSMPMLQACSCDPIRILNCYLRSLSNGCTNAPANASSTVECRGNPIRPSEIDGIIRVTDFLFGSNSSSLVEGAFAVLDSAETIITKVISAASRRSLFLVRGSSARSRGSHSEYYLCILPDEIIEDEGVRHHSCGALYYCSCRSFLERSRSTSDSNTCLCKHLLALALLSSLSVKTATVETLSDEEFSTLLLTRLGM